MKRLTSDLTAAAVLGQIVGQLGWIDPLFIPLILLAPPISGAVSAARHVSYAWVAVLWASVGICMTWSDWVVNHEDVLFHLALATAMPGLAAIGYFAVHLAIRPRHPSTS